MKMNNVSQDDIFTEEEIDSWQNLAYESGDTFFRNTVFNVASPVNPKQAVGENSSNGKVTCTEEELISYMGFSVDLTGTSKYAGSSISQDKTFSYKTPTDELHQMLKTDGLGFDEIESFYLSAKSSMLSEEGFEEFDSVLSDIEFQESIKLKENKPPSPKTPPSRKHEISENHVSSSTLDHVNSPHSSCDKASSQLSHSQDVKETLPQISPIEKIQVWMKAVPDSKSDSTTDCKKSIPMLQLAGDNSATNLCTKHSSDLSPNNDSFLSASNTQERLCDHNSSEKCKESIETSYSMHKEDDSIFKLHESGVQNNRGGNISDFCPTSDNGQELTGEESSEKQKRIVHLNTEVRSCEENTVDVLTLMENDSPEINTSAHHVSNFAVCALSSTNSQSFNDQSSGKHVETSKWSSPTTSSEDENMSYERMLHENNKRDNIPSTSRHYLLKSDSDSPVTDSKESSSDQQYYKRLPKIFDSVSTSAPCGNENLSDAGPSGLCAKAKNKSYSYGEEQAPFYFTSNPRTKLTNETTYCNYGEEQPPFNITSYPRTKLTNGTTDCFSPSSSKLTTTCSDTVYNNYCENIKSSAFNERQCTYSETSTEILDVCNLLPQQKSSMEHMYGTASSSRILNTVIIECTENIPLPSASDLGANVVEFSMVRGDFESKEVYCAYKMVRRDLRCTCEQDDNPLSSILECKDCITISTEQSRCVCSEHSITLSTEQSRCTCSETRERDISSTCLMAPPANLIHNNDCMNSHFFQGERCSVVELSPSSCNNIPPVSSGTGRTYSSQTKLITLKELPHIQEPTVPQETKGTENSNFTNPLHCVSQQANMNNKIEAEIKYKKVQKNKTNRRRKGKNNRLRMSQRKRKVSFDTGRTDSSQTKVITLTELPHIQEPTVSQENESTENSNSIRDSLHCVAQQAIMINKSEAEIKSKEVQKNKTNRSRKCKNKELSHIQEPTVSQETKSTENSNSKDPVNCVSQQATMNNNKSEAEIKSKNVQKNKTNRSRKCKNKELSHIQEPTVSQETKSTENSNSKDLVDCVFQQATMNNNKSEAEIKSKKVQKNKTNRTRKCKNKELSHIQEPTVSQETKSTGNSNSKDPVDCVSQQATMNNKSEAEIKSKKVPKKTNRTRKCKNKELSHIQEPTVSQETKSTENSNSTHPVDCVFQQATMNNKSKAEIKSKKVQKNKTNRTRKCKNKELSHIQEHTVSQETKSTENSNLTDRVDCVSQQATMNNKSKAEIKSKKVQKNKTNIRSKGKNKLHVSQQKRKVANKPKFNKQDVIAPVVRLDVSDFSGDFELTLS